MTPTPRLLSELQRLYLPPGVPAGPDWTARLAAPDGRLRALVLELRRPADWAALGRVWQGVQADHGLPAPAIAVSGSDGVQLWFALQQPVTPAEGAAWLAALCRRHLADLPAHRLRLLPGSDGWEPPPLPALQGSDDDGERWSAFVAPDLAPMFSDTPWLGVAPNPDGQAALLAGLRAAAPDDVARVLADDAAAGPGADAGDGSAATDADATEAGTAAPPVGKAAKACIAAAIAPTSDPRAFLLAVMNDAAVPLALRIDAAKALLAAR